MFADAGKERRMLRTLGFSIQARWQDAASNQSSPEGEEEEQKRRASLLQFQQLSTEAVLSKLQLNLLKFEL